MTPTHRHTERKCIHFDPLRRDPRCLRQFASFQSSWGLGVLCILDWLPNRSQNSYSSQSAAKGLRLRFHHSCDQHYLPSGIVVSYLPTPDSRVLSKWLSGWDASASASASASPVRKRLAKSVINVRIFCCRIIAVATARQKLPVQIERIIASRNCKHTGIPLNKEGQRWQKSVPI